MKPEAILFSSSTRYPHGMLRLIPQIKPFPFRDIDRKSTLDKNYPAQPQFRSGGEQLASWQISLPVPKQ